MYDAMHVHMHEVPCISCSSIRATRHIVPSLFISMTAAKVRAFQWPILVCTVAFVAFFLLGGIMYATGVLFSELLKMPCDVDRPMRNDSSEENTPSSSCGGISNVTLRCEYQESANVSQTAADAEQCGGFGESRGRTGEL